MRSILITGAAALTLAIVSAPAVAQTPAPAAEPPASSDMSAPSTGAASSPSAGANTAAGSDASATVAVGTTVKDNTGAAIGQITEVKPDPSGKQVATIKMGADTFAVETDKLGVQDGAATINATQAELKSMLKK